MKADRDWRVARVYPLAGFDRMLVAFALYPVAPILLFLLGWWISLLFVEDNQVFLGAIGGLAIGITADLVYVKRRLELAYQMPGWFWHLIYIFFSVCCFGFFMGVPVFNLVLGVPAGIFIARKARANGLSDERVKREIDAASKMTAVYILLFSLASASIALIDPYTAANLKGMLNLSFEVTRNMILGLIIIGGGMLVAGQYLVTKTSAYFTLRPRS